MAKVGVDRDYGVNGFGVGSHLDGGSAAIIDYTVPWIRDDGVIRDYGGLGIRKKGFWMVDWKLWSVLD